MTTQIETAVEQAVNLSTDDITISSGGVSMLQAFARIGEILPPWWSKARDGVLRGAWKDDGYLSGFMNLGRSKLAGIPIKVVARNSNIAAHVAQAELMTEIINSASEYGEGLAAAIDKGAEDYLGQDNGMFLEIVADGEKNAPISGAVKAIIHRDSARCQRTGNPLYPVLYHNLTGKPYLYHWTRIIAISENRSGKAEMNSVGYCAVSRSVKLATGMMSALNYRLEKMGARPVNRILVGDGIEGSEILQAMIAAQGMMNELGLQNFVNTVAIGGQDIDIKKVDLNEMQNFDEESIVTVGLHSLAFIWGIEPNEVLQISGSKSSDQVALQRSRSKLPQRFIENFMPHAWKIVPPHLQIVMDYVDDFHDHQRALIDDINARNTSRNLESGVTTASIERRRLFDTQRITKAQFRNMQLSGHLLEDDTPVASLFFNNKYSDLLLLPKEALMPSVFDYAEAISMIEANEVAIYSVMGSTKSEAVVRRCAESLSALDWLKGKYKAARMDAIQEEPIKMGKEDEEEEERSQKGFFRLSKSRTYRKLKMT